MLQLSTMTCPYCHPFEDNLTTPRLGCNGSDAIILLARHGFQGFHRALDGQGTLGPLKHMITSTCAGGSSCSVAAQKTPQICSQPGLPKLQNSVLQSWIWILESPTMALVFLGSPEIPGRCSK